METKEIAVQGQNGMTVRDLSNDDLTYIQRLGNLLSASGYFSDAREMAQAAVKVMAGRELGIAPIASMMGINVIKGKVALSGNLIASRIRAHGYEFVNKQMDGRGCVLEFMGKPAADGKRRKLGESSFTEEDAKAAGLLASDMYKKYPRNMFFNRAMSNGAKWYTPEVFAGAPIYTPEELGATVDEEGNVVHQEAAVETQQHVAERRIAEVKAQAPAIEEKPVAVKQALPVVTKEDFGKLRTAFLEFGTGGAAEYDRVMGKHCEPGKTFPATVRKAQAAYAELQESLKTLAEFMQPKTFQATDDDLPPFGEMVMCSGRGQGEAGQGGGQGAGGQRRQG